MKHGHAPALATLLAAILIGGCAAHPPTKASSSQPFDLPTVPRTRAVPAEPLAAKPHRPAQHVRPAAASLRSYGSCGQLVRAMRAEGLKEVTPYGLAGNLNHPMMVDSVPVMAGAERAPAPAAAPVGAAGSAFSGTNNQEADVDEPDLVKTDGYLMVVSSPVGSTLRVVDVSGPKPEQMSTMKLSLDYQPKLLLVGTDVVAIGTRYNPKGYSESIAQVISLTDPRHPVSTRVFAVRGELLDARLLGGRILLVTQSGPMLPFAYPTSATPQAEATALRTNRALIKRTTRAELLPSITVTPGGHRYDARCGQTMHPGVASGLGTTSVVTIDPAQPAPTGNLTIVGSGSVVYASSAALYLATTAWQSQVVIESGHPRHVTTDLHGFDVSTPDQVRYLGTGSVAGTLVDQYSMSEHKGYLRVATTVGEPTPASGEGLAPRVRSDNRVTVLQPVDGALVQVGQVRGLGRGEKIYGVRFVGDVGYVVTFRQIDPLFVLDLADPRKPLLKGELEVTGYSSALYPLGNGQLLGVGQGVDARQRPLGTQVSVFDVRRVTHPSLLSRVLLKDAISPAQDDHHSLLWWPAKRLVVLPVSSWGDGASLNGSIVYQVSEAGTLRELGRIQPPQPQESAEYGARPYCCSSGILRTVAVGDLLYSVTDTGLATTPMDRLDHLAWFPFD
jgi:uncharacterized secreted protein with C-terminal beta-propeller domain